jgi:molybdenum cofactor cytidylyltransferase
MRVLTLDLIHASGRILFRTIFGVGGKKLLSRGHLLSDEDARMLETEGIREVWVTELEEGEIGEDEAVMAVAAEIGSGSLEIRLAAGGRANLIATEPSCTLVDVELLKHVNCASTFAIATTLNFSYAKAGQKVSTVKTTPFAVARSQLEAVISMVKERGPVLQALPIRTPSVGVLYTDPVNSDRARRLLENVMHRRLERFDITSQYVLASLEEEGAVARSLQYLLRAKPTSILIASTTAPAGPDDVVGRAMLLAGSVIERFLAPVEPGNLLLLGYKDDIPILSAPGCFRSTKTNVVDLVLPPMLAHHHVSGWDVASLGHGGLLG